MVYLSDIMDVVLLGQHVKNGLVTSRRHESLPLAILNYTPECQYSRAWDEVTRKCRGLIYNTQTLEVVARPFEKFGNWDESGYPFPPSGPAIRMEKMDGSLGILYWDESDPMVCIPLIATRGSFHSEQAEWASQEIQQYFPGAFEPLNNKTYLFEIIYRENRIVVDYGDYEGLMLLDVIDNETGFSDTDEFDNCDWPDKVVRQHVPGFDSGQVVDIPAGGEGFVFLWPAKNFRTKMKSAEYVFLHKVVSGLNDRSIWEHLSSGKTLDELKKNLPEEFHDYVDRVGNALMSELTKVIELWYNEFTEVKSDLPEGFSRKDFAVRASNSPYRAALFQILDEKSVVDAAWREVRPAAIINGISNKE
jgi:RNA ligase